MTRLIQGFKGIRTQLWAYLHFIFSSQNSERDIGTQFTVTLQFNYFSIIISGYKFLSSFRSPKRANAIVFVFLKSVSCKNNFLM